MSTLFWELLDNYIRQAWPFSALHLLCFIYFIYRWRQSRRQVNDLLGALADESRESDLLKYAEEQMRRYAGQGREPDLPRIERYVVGRLENGPDTIRPLVNTFVVIGLMGTLFSLFALGHESQQQHATQPKQILGRMGVAFATSFFGIILALICSVLFLTPLRRRTNRMMQGVSRWLTELSAASPPRTPERTFEQLAETLRENVSALGETVRKMSRRDAEHMKAMQGIMAEFSGTTSSILENLATKVEEAQGRAEETAAGLKKAVTESLTSLQASFVEISRNWREEIKLTLKSSEKAAASLSLSSQHLTVATKDVAESLQSVRESLAKTGELARIADDVQRLTDGYLERTRDQIDAFRNGIESMLDVSRTVPDEWFTMLTLSGDRLVEQWREATGEWRKHVSDTSDLLSTRLSLINDRLDPVAKLFAPNGGLVNALDHFGGAVAEVRGMLAERVLAESHPPREVDRTPEGAAPSLEDEAPSPPDELAGGLDALNAKVKGIHTLLADLLDRLDGHNRALPLFAPSSALSSAALEPADSSGAEPSPADSVAAETSPKEDSIPGNPPPEDHSFVESAPAEPPTEPAREGMGPGERAGAEETVGPAGEVTAVKADEQPVSEQAIEAEYEEAAVLPAVEAEGTEPAPEVAGGIGQEDVEPETVEPEIAGREIVGPEGAGTEGRSWARFLPRFLRRRAQAQRD